MCSPGPSPDRDGRTTVFLDPLFAIRSSKAMRGQQILASELRKILKWNCLPLMSAGSAFPGQQALALDRDSERHEGHLSDR